MTAPAPLVIEFRLGGVACIVCGRSAIALIPKRGVRHDDSCCRLPPTPSLGSTPGAHGLRQRALRQPQKARAGAPRRVTASNVAVFPSGRGRI
jgi:hypothetical protein